MKNQYRSMLLGGLLTKGIKQAYKSYKKAGGRSITEIMKSGVKGAGKRKDAKDDLRLWHQMHGGKNLTKADLNKLR